MKKLSFLLAIAALFAVTNVQAQSKKCCASKTAATCSKDAKAKVASAELHKENEMYAAKMAAVDETVERKVCAESGTVSYMRKETCEKTGTVSLVNVNFDAESGQFVNISPSEMAKKCAKGEKAACCKKGEKGAASAKADVKAETKKVKLVKQTSGTK